MISNPDLELCKWEPISNPLYIVRVSLAPVENKYIWTTATISINKKTNNNKVDENIILQVIEKEKEDTKNLWKIYQQNLIIN